MVATRRILNHSTSLQFPLSVSSNGRYLQTPYAQPFLLLGVPPSNIEVQCTAAQIKTILDYVHSSGFNCILFATAEHHWGDNTPVDANLSGDRPFNTQTNFSTANDIYFANMDTIVAGAKIRGILCLIYVMYWGFEGTEEGWDTEIKADTQAHRQAFGAYLATRYGGYGNIIWVLGGDNTNGLSYDQDWIAGMQSIRSDQLFTGHSARTNDAYSKYSTNIQLNSIYTDGSQASYAATAYGRAGPVPFFYLEGFLEGDDNSPTHQDLRRQSYASMLSGACGALFANLNFALLGAANAGGSGTADAIANSMNTTACQQFRHVKTLLTSQSWHLLVPKTDASLVTTSLGTGASTICPARASDGSFAMIFTPSANFSVAMGQLTPSSVRARWFDPGNGTYTTDGASPLANSGTHAFTTPGTNSDSGTDWILVLDAP